MSSELDGLAAKMRRLETVAPIELNMALERIALTRVLPGAKSRAPHKSGRLAGSLSVVPGPPSRGAAVKSPLVYANVQHWGGRTWHARSRVGRSTKPAGRAIKGTRFVQATVEQDGALIARDIGNALDRMMQKHLA